LALCIDKICVLKEYPYIYRQRIGSITKNTNDKVICDLEGNIKKSLAIIQNCKLRDSIYIYIAQFMTIYVISLAMADESLWDKHKEYLLKNRYIFKYGIRRREKILYLMLSVFGRKITLKLIKAVSIWKRKRELTL